MTSLAKKWFRQADYDLATAEAMYKSCRYLYVAFMCQQAIEKLLKGIIYERTSRTPPYSHRLVALLDVAEIKAETRLLDFLDLLTRYYIDARYPEHKAKLSATLNKKTCGTLLKKSKEYFQWLREESGI